MTRCNRDDKWSVWSEVVSVDSLEHIEQRLVVKSCSVVLSPDWEDRSCSGLYEEWLIMRFAFDGLMHLWHTPNCKIDDLFGVCERSRFASSGDHMMDWLASTHQLGVYLSVWWQCTTPFNRQICTWCWLSERCQLRRSELGDVCYFSDDFGMWVKALSPTWFEHAAFWSGVRRATVAPRARLIYTTPPSLHHTLSSQQMNHFFTTTSHKTHTNQHHTTSINDSLFIHLQLPINRRTSVNIIQTSQSISAFTISLHTVQPNTFTNRPQNHQVTK